MNNLAKKSGERLREIVSVLASYGFGHIYRTKIGKKDEKQDAVDLRRAFEELGPSFIKIGQIISTRRDLLPPDYIEELQKLQDNAPEFPFKEIERVFKEEFDQEIHDVFLTVDKNPLASASVAQVHSAKMRDGKEVIIKVQRPDIEESLLRDIRLFSRILSMAPGTIKEIIVDTKAAFEEIENSTRNELDFRNEATAIMRFNLLNRNIAAVHAPEVVSEYVAKRVIVEEYIDGIKIVSNQELLEQGYVKEDIAEKLVLSFLSQVFKDGFFHGDPHPGNLIISNRKINYIDFGIVGELSDGNKKTLIQMLKSIVYQDVDKLMNLLIQLGISKKRVDKFYFYEDLSYFFESYVSRSFSELDMGVLFADILEITRKHQITMPNDFIMLVKSFTILEGVVTDMTPNINLLEIAKSYIKSSDDISFFEPLSKEKLLLNSYQMAKDTIKIPSQIRQLLDTVNSGRAKFHVDLVDIDNKWTGLNKMVNRIVFAVIIAALILSSALIIVMSESSSISLFGAIIFVGAGLMGLWLLISIIRSGTL